MNTKLFYRLCISLVVGLAITACTNDDGSQVNSQRPVAPDESGMYHYQLDLSCNAPSYDEGTATRGIVNTWDDAASIIVRFKNGTKFITGTATYSSSDKLWSIKTSESLPVISGEGTCELYYFTGASVKDASVTMTENTACYFTTSATYVRPSETSVAIQASLGRKTWRLRFKGESGTTITLPKNDNDIKYFSAFNGQTGSFTDSQKEITLSVDKTGYTPYVYGTFVNSSGSNTITVKNGNRGYTKELTNTDLKVGESAFLNIPTESSYKGWEVQIDPEASINIDYAVTFTDGIVTDFKIGKNTSFFNYTIGYPSNIESLTDDEIAEGLLSGENYSAEEAEYVFGHFGSSMSSSTDYCLVAAAMNNSGVRGPVLRYNFTTNSATLPIAEVSNVTAKSSNEWSFAIDLKNNATSYYLVTDTSEDFYSMDGHYFAWVTHYWATNGQLESYDWTAVKTTLNSGTCQYLSVCTWALDSRGRIGNPHVGYGNATSSARMRADEPKTKKMMMPKESLVKARDHMTIHRVAAK